MKTFIVATSWEDYDAAIASRRLNPGECFYCLDWQEAARNVDSNRRWGVDTRIIVTPAVQALTEAERVIRKAAA